MAKKENSSKSTKKEEKIVFNEDTNDVRISIISNEKLNRTTLLLYFSIPPEYMIALVKKETTPNLDIVELERNLKDDLYKEVKQLHKQGRTSEEDIKPKRIEYMEKSTKLVNDEVKLSSKFYFTLFKTDDKRYDIERMQYFKFHLPGSDHQIEEIKIAPIVIKDAASNEKAQDLINQINKSEINSKKEK